MMLRYGTVLLAAGLLLPRSSSGQVDLDSEVADAVSAWTDTHMEEVHALLRDAVDINSGTSNHEGVRAVGELFRTRLARIGFDARWVEVKPVVDRAGHVLATRAGRGSGRRVLLIGHLDTVFEPGHPFDRLRPLEGERASGPGVVDDKGGVVVLVSALEALHAAGGLDGADITVLLTGDEESVGHPREAARQAMVAAARDADVILSFERGFTADGEDFGTVARRSSSRWLLRVTGRQAHSGRIFSEADGVGAANELARILHEFYTELAGEEYLTFNAGTVVSGTEISFDEETQRGTTFGRSNVIPSQALARGDIRTISNEQLERTRERMRAIVARHLPGTSAQIEFEDGYPAMAPAPGNYTLLGEYSAVSEALGLGALQPLDPGLRGAGDIAFAADLVPQALDGLGAMGGDTHGPEEWVDLASFGPQIRRAAMLVHHLTHTAAPGAM